MRRNFNRVVLGTAILVLAACSVDRSGNTETGPAPAENRTASTVSEPAAAGPGGAPEATHDPSRPPIDCPLRKLGIKPEEMRPFEDVEKYIAFLERGDRDAWQRPDAVVASLGLSGSETVVDLGAGSGYFSFRLARALPRGKVVAVDIEPEMIRHIHHKAMTTGVENLEVRLADPGDPSIPKQADWVFVCDVLHHVRDRQAWLSRMHTQMKPGARVALIEFKEGDLPEGPPESVKLAKSEIIDLMKAAGFLWLEEKKDLLPYQNVLIFRKG